MWSTQVGAASQAKPAAPAVVFVQIVPRQSSYSTAGAVSLLS